MTTPILGLGEWIEDQNQPHVPVNGNVRALEVFAAVVRAQAYKSEPDDSNDEQEGDVFLVLSPGAGTWVGHDNEIAYYSNGLKFLPPAEGMLATIGTDQILQYTELDSAGPGWYSPSWLPAPESSGAEAEPYVVASMSNGVPGASVVVMRHVFPLAAEFLEDLADSQGFAETAATGSPDFDLQKNGVSVGTITFAASDTATFDLAGGASFAPGDVLTIVAPGSPDATLADITFSLLGTR